MSIINSKLDPAQIAEIFRDCEKVYLIGAGGVGMYSVARLFFEHGISICGYDRREDPLICELRTRGAEIATGADIPDISGCSAAVYTAAADRGTPEVRAASDAALPMVSRADALQYLCRKKTPSVAVCGMHGKSTTVSMAAHIWSESGREPSVCCGASMTDVGSPYVSGREGVIYEACEYMNSFHSFYPDIGVVLNIDDDHTDCFPHISDAVESFSEFLSHCSGAVLNLDCQNVMQAAHGFCGEILTFSAEDRHADIYAAQCSWQYGRPSFVLRYRGQDLGRISLSVPGAFNISNALAAAGAAIMHGISPQAICFGLSSCRGCRRRMEYRGCHMGVAYYDDYAHHPAEVASSLAAVRMFTSGRIICVFQAHTYSRVAAHLAAFGEALRLADIVVVSDIYAARESDTLNMSAQVMADCIGDTARAISCDTEIAEYITSAASAGDTVIIMGAGDIDRLFDLLSVQ